MTIAERIAYARKAIINVIGLLGALLTLGLLPSDYAAYVSTAIAILTAIVHYQVPNIDPAGADWTAQDAPDPSPKANPQLEN